MRYIGFGVIGAWAVTLSTFLTSLVLLYAWSWFGPVDFWQKLVAAVFTIIVGVVLFIAFAVLFVILFMPFSGKKKKRRKRSIYVEGYE